MKQIQKFKITEKEFIGVDEVGRGSLIGPVITCAVYLNSYDFKKLSKIPYKIDDSKKINKKTRKQIVDWINTNNIKYHIGSASVQEIDELNIREANNLAMNRAILDLINKNNITTNLNCYIDGNYFNNITNIPQSVNFKTVIKGDATNIAIALASIIAKEYRDDLITEIANQKQFTPYNWIKNMGYGTEAHQRAIMTNGLTCYHRLTFVKKLISKKIIN